MIVLNDCLNCCGCSACAQRCPLHCITMQEDGMGFLYPKVDEERCVDCGLCEQVCPCLNQGEPQRPILIEAAINTDTAIRIQSSSGGIFTMLAEKVLKQNGVVFGAKFNEKWEVTHDWTETRDGLRIFRGSKYAQSVIGDSYQKAETFLKSGHKVLFSGTPCQITGLLLFLQKEYQNLSTISIACHSVPSPLVWREYLKSLELADITEINFRDKRHGWERYGLCIRQNEADSFFQEYGQNPYMQLFLHGLSTRPSCFKCPSKNGRGRGDIIIGDCWGVSQILPCHSFGSQGVSFMICQTEKGLQTVKEAGIEGVAIPYNQVIQHNGGLTTQSKMPIERAAFWKAFMTEKDKPQVLRRFAKPYLPSFKTRLKNRLFRKR